MFEALKLLPPQMVEIILGGTIALGTLSIALLSAHFGYKRGYNEGNKEVYDRFMPQSKKAPSRKT